jgi:hypothetical protein
MLSVATCHTFFLLHCNAVCVQGEGLLSLAGARPPVAVDYRDYCRPLKRLLKQMGSGSITAGARAAVAVLSKLLDVLIDRGREGRRRRGECNLLGGVQTGGQGLLCPGY